MATPDREQLHFDAIKEDRGSYFVEYHPPGGNNAFATLSIVYSGTFELKQVAECLRTETIRWLARYPVPVMVHAFDAAENIIMPNGASDDGLLVGWLVPGTEEVALSRKLNELPAFVNDTTSHPDWRTIYKDVPFMTRRRVTPASPYSRTGAFGCDCSNRRKRETDAEDAARQIPRYGQGIPVGSTRLASHNSHSAMATAARSADPEYPSREGAG